jgi:antibiotic biosynthesis monooxygenase (ABM) superfamily enzyme
VDPEHAAEFEQVLERVLKTAASFPDHLCG